MSENIKINMIKKGYNRKDIADKSIVKYSTLCYRIKCPETLTIKELCIIANTLFEIGHTNQNILYTGGV